MAVYIRNPIPNENHNNQMWTKFILWPHAIETLSSYNNTRWQHLLAQSHLLIQGGYLADHPSMSSNQIKVLWVSPSLPSRAAAELWFCNHHFSLTERNDTFSQYCLIADCSDLQLLKADFIGGNGATGGWGRAIMNEKMSCLVMTTLGKSLLQEKGGAPGRDDWAIGNEANQNNSIEYFNGGVECSSEMTIAGNWHASFMLPACHIRYDLLVHITCYMLYKHVYMMVMVTIHCHCENAMQKHLLASSPYCTYNCYRCQLSPAAWIELYI